MDDTGYHLHIVTKRFDTWEAVLLAGAAVILFWLGMQFGRMTGVQAHPSGHAVFGRFGAVKKEDSDCTKWKLERFRWNAGLRASQTASTGGSSKE